MESLLQFCTSDDQQLPNEPHDEEMLVDDCSVVVLSLLQEEEDEWLQIELNARSDSEDLFEVWVCLRSVSRMWWSTRCI